MRRAVLTVSSDLMAIGLGLEPGVSILGVRNNEYGEIELLLDGGSLRELPDLEPVPRVKMMIETKIHAVFGGQYHEAHWDFSDQPRWPTLLCRANSLLPPQQTCCDDKEVRSDL